MCARIDTRFEVKWYQTCYICNNPLDMMVIPNVSSKEFLERFLAYRVMYPFEFMYNKSIYKFFGLKARKVCLMCFANEPHRINPKRIALREVSGNRIRPMGESKTTEELYSWFESFNRFINKPDIDDYVNDPITHISTSCLRLFDDLYRNIDRRELQRWQI